MPIQIKCFFTTRQMPLQKKQKITQNTEGPLKNKNTPNQETLASFFEEKHD